MAYSKLRWFSTPAFLACIGGAHGRGEGTNARGRERLSCGRERPRGGGAHVLGGRERPRGGRCTWFSGGHAWLGGARTVGGLHGSREWGQGRGFAFVWLLLCMIG
jgi:hypothetical protein